MDCNKETDSEKMKSIGKQHKATDTHDEELTQIQKISKDYLEIFKVLKKRMKEDFESCGIKMSDGMVMSLLMKNGRMKVSELGKRTGIAKSTLSDMLDRLEKAKIIERERDDNDKRSVYVNLTGEMNEKHNEAIEKINKNMGEMLKKASEEEVEQIINGLDVFCRIIKESDK